MKRTVYITSTIISYTLLLVLLYASVTKLINYDLFKDEVAEAMPESLVPYITTATLFSEFIAIVTLFFPKWRKNGFRLTIILLSIFTIYIIKLNLTSEGLSCACGGLIELLSPWQHVLLNASLLLLSITGVYLDRKIRKMRITELSLTK